MDNIKKCIRCNSEKEESLFHFNTSRHKYSGVFDYCCHAHRKEYNENNLKQNNETKKAWAKKNKHKVAKSRKKWKEDNIGKVKADKARRKTHVELATPKWL